MNKSAQKSFQRCTGHCCRRFALKHSFIDLQNDYNVWLKDKSQSKIRDVEKISQMVIPLQASESSQEYVYTCKHLDKQGNCTVYETRPQMCRDFPDSNGCHFWKCTSSQSAYFGLPLWRKVLKRISWLKGLGSKEE